MANDPKPVMSKQAASAANLLAHPAAGVAAFSAIGIGMASQAFGFWIGVVEATARAQQRMFDQSKPVAPVAQPTSDEPKAAASKARAATRVLMEEAQSFARDVESKKGQSKTGLRGGKAAPGNSPQAEFVRAKAVVSETIPSETVAKAVVEPAATLVLRQPKTMKKPASPDDLKAISGIGPKLETVLNGLGVWTYRQIAGWTDGEIGWIDNHLGFGGRIGRDGWTGQAKTLADGKTKN